MYTILIARKRRLRMSGKAQRYIGFKYREASLYYIQVFTVCSGAWPPGASARVWQSAVSDGERLRNLILRIGRESLYIKKHVCCNAIRVGSAASLFLLSLAPSLLFSHCPQLLFLGKRIAGLRRVTRTFAAERYTSSVGNTPNILAFGLAKRPGCLICSVARGFAMRAVIRDH